MTENEREHLRELLNTCRDLLSVRGCNDFPVPNTDENWELFERMMAWGTNATVEAWRAGTDFTPRPDGGTIYFTDWLLLSYLGSKL